MPKFDVVVGNPPYEGKYDPLYLQILDKVNKITDEILWICPAQWVLYNKEHKHYYRYKNEFKNDLYDYALVRNPFNDASVANEIGIFHFKKDEGKIDIDEIRWSKYKDKNLAKSIYNKMRNYKQHINDTNRIDNHLNFYVKATRIRGNVHESKPCWDWTTLFGEKQHTDFSKDTMNWSDNFWNFDTENECKNFIASTETDICMFGLYLCKSGNNNNKVDLECIPWFGDYTREWTEKDIQKELGITDEELDYIHEEMKDFGWKTRNK